MTRSCPGKTSDGAGGDQRRGTHGRDPERAGRRCERNELILGERRALAPGRELALRSLLRLERFELLTELLKRLRRQRKLDARDTLANLGLVLFVEKGKPLGLPSADDVEYGGGVAKITDG